MNKWSKVTFSTSMYFNRTNDVFQFIRRPSGDEVITIVDGVTVITPVILSTPINLARQDRFGFEFNVNYTPYKWWKLNGNFNFFESKTTGDYTYILDNTGVVVNENFDNTAASWFTRISSKVSLPYKIDWQTNATRPSKNAQGNFGISVESFQ